MAANPNLASGTAILGSIGTSTLVAYNSSKTSFGQVTMKQTGDDMFWYYQQPNTAETDQPYIKFSDEQVTISSKSGSAGRRIVVSSQGVYLNGTEVGDLGTGGGGGGGGSASGETVDVGTGSTLGARMSRPSALTADTLRVSKINLANGDVMTGLNPFHVGEFQIRSSRDRYGNKFLSFGTVDDATGEFRDHYALTTAIENPKDGDYRLAYLDIARTVPSLDLETWWFAHVNPVADSVLLSGSPADAALTSDDKTGLLTSMRADFVRLVEGGDPTAAVLYDPPYSSWPSFTFSPIHTRRKLSVDYFTKIPFPRPIVFFSPRPPLDDDRVAIDLHVWCPAGRPHEVRVQIDYDSTDIAQVNFQTSTDYANGPVLSTAFSGTPPQVRYTKHFKAVTGKRPQPSVPNTALYLIGTFFALRSTAIPTAESVLRDTSRVDLARDESSEAVLIDSDTTTFVASPSASWEDKLAICQPEIKFSTNILNVPYDFIYK
eukprot:jgi/Mesvir1/12879/Mv05905-RA.1